MSNDSVSPLAVGREGIRMKEIALFALSIFLAACASSHETLNKELAGHYYLQDVMEMGSELLLRTDGSFEAGMVYGSADGYAKGNWTQAGQRLTLHRQASSTASEENLGQLFDGLVLHIRPNCLALEEMDGCYVKAPSIGNE